LILGPALMRKKYLKSFLTRKKYYQNALYAQKILFLLSIASLMHKKDLSTLPEIFFSSTNRKVANQLAKLLKKGAIRRLLPRVYTSIFDETDEAIVRRNLWPLIAGTFPGVQVSHRSAIEFQPSPNQVIYLTGKSRRVYKWPGVTLNFTDGPPPNEDDNLIAKDLFVSSLERACLENLLPVRKRGNERRVVEQAKIEDRLLQFLNARGESELLALRDRARQIAEDAGWTKAHRKLDAIIGSLLSAQPKDILTSPAAIAKAFGRPYDSRRLELFTSLVGALRSIDFPSRPENTETKEAYTNFAFFESYFSNYIEGTTFRVEEALKIVFENEIIPGQREDSHDVKATFEICGERRELANEIPTIDSFLTVLQQRHRILMRARPSKLPGQFKINANRAGNTYFVLPGEVAGTLERGFELLSGLTSPAARALYMMFIISEVHPFEDGNGRVARLMMNAELSRAHESKIIIPTVYREDYLLNLRRLTRQSDTMAYIRMMQRAHDFSHWLKPADYDTLKAQLESANAFDEEGRILRFD